MAWVQIHYLSAAHSFFNVGFVYYCHNACVVFAFLKCLRLSGGTEIYVHCCVIPSLYPTALLTKVLLDPVVAKDQTLHCNISHKRREALTKCSGMNDRLLTQRTKQRCVQSCDTQIHVHVHVSSHPIAIMHTIYNVHVHVCLHKYTCSAHGTCTCIMQLL